MNTLASSLATALPHLVQGTVFLFPILHPLVRHGGGTIWVLLCLGGLVWTIRARRRGLPLWRALGRDERFLLLGLLLVPLGMSLSLVNTDDWTYVGPKFEKLLQVLLFPLAYLLVRGLGAEPGRPFFWGALAAVPLMLAVGAWQMTQGAAWAHGAYYRILYGDLAVYYLTLLVVADLCWLRSRWRWVAWGAMVCAVAAVLLSGTRGAWLAALALLPVALWCYRHALSPRQWRWLGGVTALILIGVIALPGPIQDRLMEGIQDLQTLEERPGSSWGTRYHLWHLSIEVWREHPWLGTGLGDLHHEIQRAAQIGVYRASTHYDHAHNLFFDALATTGAVGLGALVLGFFLIPAWYFWRHWRRAEGDPYRRFLALAGLMGLVAFALFGLTEAWFSRMHFTRAFLMHLLVFASALALCRAPQAQGNGPREGYAHVS